MPLPAREVDRALTNKLGFERQERRHRVYLLNIGGHTVAQTLISHSAKEVDDKILSMIARQIGVNRSQLQDIVSCSLNKEDYLALLED